VNKCALAIVTLALAGIAQGAAAQNAADASGNPKTPWYVGAGIGATESSIPNETTSAINAALVAVNGAASSIVDEKSRATGLKFTLGYKFSRNLALEGGYAVLGETTVNTDFRDAGVPSASVGTFNLEYKMSAPFIDVVGILPLGEKWSLIGRVGVSYTRTSATISGAPITILVASSDQSESEAREKFGAGIDYNINAAFALRAEWERYKAPDPLSDEVFDVDTATLSMLYRF
jgi:OOP family OmpA-OmpF porin